MDQSQLTNPKIINYQFLECIYDDSYFPTFLVDKCKHILLELCKNIEAEKPGNLEDLYQLTNVSTEKVNELQDEFFENNSEIETGARECLAADFEFISQAYGFEADIEELISAREW